MADSPTNIMDSAPGLIKTPLGARNARLSLEWEFSSRLWCPSLASIADLADSACPWGTAGSLLSCHSFRPILDHRYHSGFSADRKASEKLPKNVGDPGHFFCATFASAIFTQY